MDPISKRECDTDMNDFFLLKIFQKGIHLHWLRSVKFLVKLDSVTRETQEHGATFEIFMTSHI